LPLISNLRAFVDADVLASPVPRTLLYLMRPLAGFSLVYSQHVEAEALRHQKPGHTPVDSLRRRFDWPIVEDPDALVGLQDTDLKDRPLLAGAVASGAGFVITGNVRDFGVGDLARHEISTVQPSHPHRPPAVLFRGPRCVRCGGVQYPNPDGLCSQCADP
jgi:hypothetical protein